MGATSVAKDVKTSKAQPKRVSAAARDMARSELIAGKLAKVAPDEDPAHVAGAIAIFATETIKRSANTLGEARAYLDGLRAGIDGLLKNAFPEAVQEKPRE
jgi:hypothetical protein